MNCFVEHSINIGHFVHFFNQNRPKNAYFVPKIGPHKDYTPVAHFGANFYVLNLERQATVIRSRFSGQCRRQYASRAHNLTEMSALTIWTWVLDDGS